MSQFAATTSVPVEKSRAEIEKLLTRYGASRFGSGWDEKTATILFEAKNRRVKFTLPLPSRADRAIAKDRRGYSLPSSKVEIKFEQACRQRWRSLALVIKAKLEAVESGVSEFESEFLAHIVLPGGSTVGETLRPQLVHAYETGTMPPLLGSGS